jgi:vacuolar-type H+-ATPase subunit F/Vma7
MLRAVFLGDEVTAAGYRLAGSLVYSPAAGQEAAALAAARAQAQLVLVSARVAAGIGTPVLRSAEAAHSPLTLVVPDMLEPTPLPDLATRLRTQLGLVA